MHSAFLAPSLAQHCHAWLIRHCSAPFPRAPLTLELASLETNLILCRKTLFSISLHFHTLLQKSLDLSFNVVIREFLNVFSRYIYPRPPVFKALCWALLFIYKWRRHGLSPQCWERWWDVWCSQTTSDRSSRGVWVTCSGGSKEGAIISAWKGFMQERHLAWPWKITSNLNIWKEEEHLGKDSMSEGAEVCGMQGGHKTRSSSVLPRHATGKELSGALPWEVFQVLREEGCTLEARDMFSLAKILLEVF